ncbi:RuvB-like helicase [Aphelenchoides fujianensis]|nr:RuvB-like helicase [Aphelenchoides fujianensis]
MFAEMLRDQVNKVINRYIEEGTAELLPGVLFIDEVHMLDSECFTFLHRALESRVSPIVIFATNRGLGGEENDEQGSIPNDLLDRLVIVSTKPYKREEIKAIVKLRADAEGVNLSAEAWRGSARAPLFRYVMQLLTPAKVLCHINGRDTIEVADVSESHDLFLDAKRSAADCEKEK